jgi:septal ring factor EnvC (AmiA/AmiB activator)
MSSNASSTPTTVTDEQLVVDLSAVLERAKAELAELEPKREQLSSRIASLEHTIAVYKGETPARPVRRRAASGTRRPRKSTPASAETTPASS